MKRSPRFSPIIRKKKRKPFGRQRLSLFVAVIIGLLVLAAAWRWTPLQEWIQPERLSNMLQNIASPEIRAAVAVGGITLASLLMVPITLLALVAGIVFGGWAAFAYTLAGAMLSSLIGFAVGQGLGKQAIQQLHGSKINDISKRVAQRGAVAVAILRLIPLAPFAIFNLMAGASHIRMRHFLIGSLLGMAPALGALTLFSSNLWSALSHPSWGNLLIVTLPGLVLLLFGWTAKRSLGSA